MKRWFLKLAAPIFLAFVVALIYATNFRGDFWLTGWDNLHPEFNLPTNISRAIFSAWQEYQGLGLPAGHGHATELVREVFLWLLSVAVSPQVIRKVYTALMLYVGALGVFALLRSKGTKITLSLAGSLFYLFNPITIQIFYLPYEAFTTHFGFLPWMVFSVVNFLNKKNKKALLFLVFIHFLGSAQFYIPTLFPVYLFSVAVIIVWERNLRIGLIAIATIFLVNLYWLLPFGYYLANNLHSQTEAYLNLRYSQDIYLKNAQFGNLLDTALSRGFLLDFTDFLNQGTYGFMMQPWRDYWRSWPITLVGLGVFGVSIIGVIASWRKRQNLPFIFLFLVFFSLLAVNVFPFSFLNNILRDVPILNQIFRNPFTKFANSLLLLEALFFVAALQKFRGGLVGLAFLEGAAILFNLLVLPMWAGNLVYPKLKQIIPQEYSSVFQFFRDKGNSRIANFPQFSNDGWENYVWGYRGSGFLWYGINQPILDRAFDVWSRESENYYWEVSYAIYSKNLPLLESTLGKYRVNWLLVDGNIINPSSPKALYLDEFQQMIANSNRVHFRQEFGNIDIYSFDLQIPTNSYVSLARNLPSVGPPYKWSNLDQAFLDFGDYLEGADYVYPYRTLFTSRRQADLEFAPEKLLGPLNRPIITIDPTSALNDQGAQNCNQFSTGVVANMIVGEGKDRTLQLSSDGGAVGCLSFPYPNLPHNSAYLIVVPTKNLVGRPPTFWIENMNSRRPDLATPLSSTNGLSYFVQPPMESDGLGYTFHIDNVSVGNEKTVNQIGKIEIYQIDYWGMVTQKRDSGQARMTQYESGFIVEHPNQSLYRVDLNTNGPATLILAQSYDPGWVALGAADHQLVNNWANGWTVSGGPRVVYLFFWPQLLEFLGFGVLGVFLLYIILRSWPKSVSP